MTQMCDYCKGRLLGTKVILEDPFQKKVTKYHYKCFIELANKEPEKATCQIINIKDDFPFTW